jgi:uncharacterized protein YeaO (DUF488 family)
MPKKASISTHGHETEGLWEEFQARCNEEMRHEKAKVIGLEELFNKEKLNLLAEKICSVA